MDIALPMTLCSSYNRKRPKAGIVRGNKPPQWQMDAMALAAKSRLLRPLVQLERIQPETYKAKAETSLPFSG